MAREDVEVSFNIELETRKLQQRMALFDRSIKKSSLSIDKMARREKILFGGTGEFQKHLKKAQQAQEKYAKVLLQSSQQIYQARAGLAAATTDAERAEIKKRIELYEKEKVAAIRAAKKIAQETADVLSQKVNISTDALAKDLATLKMPKLLEGVKVGDFAKEVASEAKDALSEAIGSIKGKDLAGIFKGGAGLASALLKGGGGYAGAGLKKAGAAVSEKGTAMAGKAGAGGLDKAFGGILKTLGPMLGKFGQMFGIVAKMGPLLSTLSSALVGIVKLMIDVESEAKAINKDILESAGTAELFAQEGYNASMSMMKLEDTLQNIKDQVTDPKMNLDMGTNKAQHLAVLAVLNREGTTLGELQKRLDANRDSADELRKSMSKFTDVTKMAIGFSRLFGVSVEEIAGFQSEMMHELGVNLEDTKREFSRMTAAAVESGIAANKFFAIIRGVSSDLSLYGVRIGEVTKMLKGLGKVMSPRTAQKFLQSFAQGMKGFSSDDALKMTLLGGPGQAAAIGKDLEEQKKDIIKTIASQAQVSEADAEKLLKGGVVGGKTLSMLAKEGKVTDVGAKREAFMGAERGQKQLKEGGVYGTAMAAKGLSGFGAYQFKKRAALGLSGAKDLEGSIGLRGEKSAEAAGLGGEKFDELLGIERAIAQQQKDLVAGVEAGDPEVLKQLEKAGIINASMDAQAKKDAVAKMSEKQIFDSLQSTQEKEKTIEEKMLDASQQQGKLTQSMLDKLDVLIDALFNWLYKVMVSLWDTLVDLYADTMDFFHPVDKPGSAIKESRALEKAVFASKDTKIREAFDKSGGDIWKAKGGMMETAGKQFADNLAASHKEYYALEEKKKTTTDPGELKRIDDRMKELATRKTTDWQTLTLGEKGASMDQQIKATQMIQGDPEIAKLTDYMKQEQAKGRNISVQQAADEKGVKLSSEQQNVLMEKMLWAMSPAQLTRAFGALEVYKKGGDQANPAGAGAGAAAPGTDTGVSDSAPGVAPLPTNTGQTASTAKSATTGTGTGTVTPPPVATTTTTATTGVVPAAGIPVAGTGAALPITKGDEQVMEVVGDGTTDVVNNLHDLWLALRQKGVKLDKTHTLEDIQKGTLESVRKALFEYALYTAEDPDKLLERIEDSGLDDVGKLATTFKDEKKYKEGFLANATGGIVTSVSGGIATLKPLPPGEGLASIGPGEKILPAGAGGGGGGGITLNVNGIGGADLANFLKGKMAEAIYEYKKREKLT